MSDGLKLYTVQNLHYDNDSEFILKTKTFRTFSTLSRKPSALLQQPMQAFIFSFVQIAIDFSQPFYCTLIFISFRPLHLNNFTHFLFSLKRFRFSFISPSLIFPCPFFCKLSQQALKPLSTSFSNSFSFLLFQTS